MKKSMTIAALLAVAGASQAEILFSDDFESGGFASWVRQSTSTIPASVNGDQFVSGSKSAFFPTATAGNVVTDRYSANLSRPENAGLETMRFSFWMYDTVATGGGRMYLELRSYSGDGYLLGTLEQLYAAGKNNATTYPGDVYAGGRYQGRVAFGTTTGWFNFTNTTPRSIGWHRFEVQVCPDSVKWFIDGVFARKTDRGNAGSLDCVVMGSNLGSDNHNSYYDDVKVQAHPFEFFPMNTNIVSGLAFGGTIDSLQASDDDSLFLLNDENDPNGEIEMDVYTCRAVPEIFNVTVESGATRTDISQFIELFNNNTNAYETISLATTTLGDSTYSVNPTGLATRFVGANELVKLRIRWIPQADLEAADGWLESLDLVRVTTL